MSLERIDKVSKTFTLRVDPVETVCNVNLVITVTLFAFIYLLMFWMSWLLVAQIGGKMDSLGAVAP